MQESRAIDNAIARLPASCVLQLTFESRRAARSEAEMKESHDPEEEEAQFTVPA